MGSHLRNALHAEGLLRSSTPATGRRLALVVEYEGTNYAGFQLQASEPTIQGEIEQALFRFTGEEVRIRGASRTDSGAHALGQVVDFCSGSRFPAETFPRALNHYLPDDIRIVKAARVGHEFHSRRDAVGRVYRYKILNRPWPSALRRRQCHWVRETLTVERMDQAAQDLLGQQDFRPFSPSHPFDKSAVRHVREWRVSKSSEDPEVITITCESNGFMQHQIRRTNAVLVEIGKGNLPVDAIKTVLAQNESKEANLILASAPTLPAKGLCLVEVRYRSPWIQVEEAYETN